MEERVGFHYEDKDHFYRYSKATQFINNPRKATEYLKSLEEGDQFCTYEQMEYDSISITISTSVPEHWNNPNFKYKTMSYEEI